MYSGVVQISLSPVLSTHTFVRPLANSRHSPMISPDAVRQMAVTDSTIGDDCLNGIANSFRSGAER
jgi:hypothetical protein